MLLGLLGLVGVSGFSCAQTAAIEEKTPIAFDAFGTLGATRAVSGVSGFHTAQSDLRSARDHWSGELDNRLGLQVRYPVSADLSLVAQGLLHRNLGDEVRAEAKWAYVQWRYSENLDLKLGRFQQPLFLISDEQYVGHAQPWVRPPVEVYSLTASTDFLDGIYIRYRQPLWGRTLSIEPFFGEYRITHPMYSATNVNLGTLISLTDGELTLRAMLVNAHAKTAGSGSKRVVQAIRNSARPEVADEYDLSDVSGILYYNLGLRYDAGRWLVMSEYSAAKLQRKAAPDSYGFYLTGGYRVHADWMPYLTLAQRKITGELTENRLTGTAALAANALLTANNVSQKSASLGLRWDATPRTAFKVQWDIIRPDGGNGLLSPALPAGKHHLDLFTLTMDWVY